MTSELKVYIYPPCSTCKSALNFLQRNGVAHSVLNIVENPPSKTELKTMLDAYKGELRRLFNTSGEVYRQLNLKDRMETLSRDEAFDLLSKNGKLVKRPFLIGKAVLAVGFDDARWTKLFGYSI